ncbi:MAG: HAMP domain-containing sensor histidine kinase [Pseudomonadota bacterium]
MLGINRTLTESAIPLVWCGSVMLGGAVSLWLGAPMGLAALLSAVLLAPGLVSIAARTSAGTLQRLASQHEAVLWALALSASASITGGVVSPLCGLLLLVPVVSALEGDRERAFDAALLALIGFACLVIVDQFMTLPGLPPWAWPLAVFPVAAGLGWVLATAIWIRRSPAAAPALRAPQPPPRIWRTLDPGGPICAIELTALGRVQGLSGNTAILPPIKTGQLIGLLVAEPARDGFVQALQAEGQMRLAFGAGRAARLFVRPHAHGTTLFAIPADGELKSIAAARQDGEAAIRARNLYYASLSHDLKTPLNAILGFADMMRAELKGPLPEAYRDYAEIIHESGEDLMLLVEDILDLAKADADGQSLDIEPVDLVASGRSVLRQMTGQAERREIQLVLDTGPGTAPGSKPGPGSESGAGSDAWAMADARAVRQIWQNLVSNAVKYSRRGQTVRLAARRVGDKVELRVEDEGEGMDPADLAAITAPYTQGRNASGRAGTGLGLTVVKRFADLMGAAMTIDSTKGEGTRVAIRFAPADPADYAPLEDAAE